MVDEHFKIQPTRVNAFIVKKQMFDSSLKPGVYYIKDLSIFTYLTEQEWYQILSDGNVKFLGYSDAPDKEFMHGYTRESNPRRLDTVRGTEESYPVC